MAVTVREYPRSPVPAVGAFVLRGDAILLVKRARPPAAGRWSVPGGAVEPGETIEAATVREVHEECGILVRAMGVFNVADLIERDDAGRIRFHYVLIDIECEYISGVPVPGSDASTTAWVPTRALHEHDLSETTIAAVRLLLGRRRP